MTIQLRKARSTDAGKIGEILHRFEVEAPWMPKQHSGAEAVAFCGVMIDRGWVIVACDEVPDSAHDVPQVLGFLARDGAEICALYVTPETCGQGIGKLLLDVAKGTEERLTLCTFQANAGAQRFYLREGFQEQQRSDGARNDEGLPDIEYLWIKAKAEGEGRA